MRRPIDDHELYGKATHGCPPWASHRIREHRGHRLRAGSTLVQSQQIAELEPLFHGEYAVKLKDGTKLRSGRSYRDQLRAALHLEE